MLPILSFTGFSGSGKTALVCKTVSELASRGYSVTTIKHDGHGHDLGFSGDSSKHKAAGAVCSIVSNKHGFVVQRSPEQDMTPEELAVFAPAGCDIIICEGFKGKNIPKIEVIRRKNSSERTNENDPRLVAIATDIPPEEFDTDLKVLDINDEVTVADFIEKTFLKPLPSDRLHLIVDGKIIPTKDFLAKMLTYSVQGLVKPLRGCEEPKEITIKVVLKDPAK